MELNFWSVRSSCRKWWKGAIVILACCKFYFIKEYENLVLDPSNYTSIALKQGVILYIIIEDHQFIGHYLIPLESWIMLKLINKNISSAVILNENCCSC